MSGLTNEYVENLGKIICGNKFLGTFPCDILPNVKKKKEFSLIINLSKHNTTGSHFIAIFADKDCFMYFDPLGEKCKNKDVLKFIKTNKNNRKVLQKFRKIQSNESIFCGFFCLSFLLSRKLKFPIKIFLNKFDQKNLNQNDNNVINFIQDNM
jgi:hypothetical protein